MKAIKAFDSDTRNALFGREDAEREDPARFKEYFFYSKTYNDLKSMQPLWILVGHKGIGKSALLKRAYLDDLDRHTLAVWVQPSDLIKTTPEKPIHDFNLLVDRWKGGLLQTIAAKALSEFAADALGLSDADTIGGSVKRFMQVMVEKLSQVSGRVAPRSHAEIARGFTQSRNITVYIDDIDRGWSASDADIRNISALINARRDISGDDKRIRFRLGLRSDVYFLVRTSDESTDKIESNVLWLKWTNHEILCVIAKRIGTFFGTDSDQDQIFHMHQGDISGKIISKIMDARFQGRGHWSNRPIHNVLLSLTRQRPRDLVKLMHTSAVNAFKANNRIISSQDLESSFGTYSGERLQDVINEFKTELPSIERLLLGLKPKKKARKAAESYLFSTDALVLRLKEVMGHTSLQYRNGRPVTPRSLIQFLYK